MTEGRHRLGMTASIVRPAWWHPIRRRRHRHAVTRMRAAGTLVTVRAEPSIRRRLELRAVDVLCDVWQVGTKVPDLRRWPVRALLAAVACSSGRRHLAHRWRAWTALPGERWRDGMRMVDAVVVRVPRPGTAVLRCAGYETLRVFPGALDDLTVEVTTRDRALRGMVFRPVLTPPQVPRVWHETVDLRDWRRI